MKATDADWSAGEGPVVTGPLLPLIQAMSGREAGSGELGGDGAATLADRRTLS
jgi:hypothetical protein